MAYSPGSTSVSRCAIAFALLLGSACPALAQGWVPIHIGNEWGYRISQTAEYAVGGQTVSRESKTGRYLREIVKTGNHDDVPVPVFVFEDVRKWNGSGEDDRMTSLGAERGGAFLEYAMDAGDGLVMHGSPLVYVPASVKGGMSWDVGSLQLSGLTIEMRGEILGLQTARTPAGPFERCLKIHYSGPVTGMIELEDGRLPVRRGQMEVTHWLAPGVGLVMAEETLSLDLLTAQGTMKGTMTDRYALERYQVEGAPVPASRAP